MNAGLVLVHQQDVNAARKEAPITAAPNFGS
jgi:hypothetical protein